ncbi:MAG: beta-ketoacyl-[acyl-carrier-protein] synthase family protein [Nevskiaceae bacterium]|nr:beta-ketoacyl-[acyl-carrier-protein] synthase family protein [Nevskiaceae bacterium]
MFEGCQDFIGNVQAGDAVFFGVRPEPDWPDVESLSSPGLRPNLFAVAAASEAIRLAGLAISDLRGMRVGVCLGSTVGGTNYQEEFLGQYFTGQLPDAAPLLKCYDTNSAQFLSRYLGLRGPVLLVNNACTSGADAIGVGSAWLENDVCDMAICGGTETVLAKIFLGFRSLMLCSPNGCRPFDRDRAGLVLGEGAGIVVLERADSPRRAQALLLGCGMASDSHHPTAPDPQARGLDRAVSMAFARSGCALEAVDFISAHGTGTPSSDLAEGRWIRGHANHARVVATKGYTGHTLGAAGGIAAVLTALSLIDGKIPPSRGFMEMDPEIGITPTCAVEAADYRLALSLSLGFGGTNSALLLARAP